MQTAEIRQRWFSFFADRGHSIVPSASLVSDDPSLLFNIAGMVPFIPYLSGLVPSPWPRATSIQKCIRTTDIEEVGRTPRHGTFFQMAGNFSFGDYFKRDAISYAWDFLTSDEVSGGLGFRPEDLWVTVFKDDEEAIRIWREVSGLPDSRIQRLDEETNFWSTGQPGPAGPSSEIFFDRGPAYGRDGGPATDDDRYVEIWNLVFLQYRIDNVASKVQFEIVGELPDKNIDTGMGLERVAFLKQGVENMYEIDEVRPVLDKAAQLSQKVYGKSFDDDVRLRIVADHVRSALMLIHDEIHPSNEGRGYVLRRLLRRVVRSMRLLGVEQSTFSQLFPVSRDAMGAAYPEIVTDFERISKVAYAEEAAFLKTLAAGTAILDSAIADTKSNHSNQLRANTAFTLHDTFGFPIDLTLEIAAESGLVVDRQGFESLMSEQRTRAKADSRSKKAAASDLTVYRAFRAQGETVFTGYETLSNESRVLGLIVQSSAVSRAEEGDRAEVILAETSLYAEAGGQKADAGLILGSGFELEVLDVQRPIPGLVAHQVRVHAGAIEVGDLATTVVDAASRNRAAQAHSATHLIHAALRETLGPEAHQAGSYNRPGYLRFDFSWSNGLSAGTRSEVEEIVNSKIDDELEVVTRRLSLAEARAHGATALFGEKYGETVRMVDIGGPWSRELCAGTHVANSRQIGLVNIVGESSIGSSSRRIEALVGVDAYQDFAVERAIVGQLRSVLNVPREQMIERVSSMADELKRAEKRVGAYKAAALAHRIPALLEKSERVGGLLIVAEPMGVLHDVDDLRSIVAKVRDSIGSSEAGVVALGGEILAKPVVVIATTERARGMGIKAGALAQTAASLLGGGGGGKDDLAQGGGSFVAKIPSALAAIVQRLRDES